MMMDDVVIRDVRPDDVETICQIAVAAWDPIFDHFRELMGEELFAATCPDRPKEKARQVRRACLPDSSAIVSVAEVTGEVVGFVTFYADEASGIGEIGNNAVHPDFQGRGIGTRQCERILEIFREKGVKFARVSTGLDDASAPARRQYEKAGFTHQTSTVTYYVQL